MNFGMVIKVIGNLLMFEAAALLPSLGIAFYYQESDFFAFLQTIILILIFGYSMAKMPVKSNRLKTKEAITIVTVGWVVVSIFGALPFVISGALPSFVDAFFETVSGLTTTGATVIDNIEILPHGILFWRSLMHWIGGMGILVLALAIMPTIGVGAFQIFKAESPGPISDKLVPKMKDTAKILYTAYLGITVIETILLLFGGMNLYEALIHTFGTVGTGGFSTRNASIGAFNSRYITTVITVFMVASGVNFSLYYELYRGRIRNITKNIEFKVYMALFFAISIIVTINLFGYYDSPLDSIQHGFFQVASIMTTTGYSTVDFDVWPSFSKAILFFTMFIGGSAGSTGGSIKVIRLIILFKLVKREMVKLLHPRAMIPIELNGKMLSTDVIANVTGFFFLYLLLFIAGTLFVSLEGIGFLSAASAVAASIGNIGPGFDLVGPTQTYSFFSAPSKIVLSLLMLFGRLELFTIFLLFTPSHWKKD
ncbi:MAG: TrkH family potassium uptake protein [Clostridiales bacterium]|nr:TrkH family potassium uptake protein [Clostridiales bacterium]